MIFHCKVQNGAFIPSERFFQKVSSLDGDVDVTIEKHRDNRSNNQNAYYWGVVVKILSDELGYSLGEMHEVLKGKFLGELKKVGDEVIHYTKSTTGLNTAEFEVYTRSIREWASVELDIYIPQPNEVELGGVLCE